MRNITVTLYQFDELCEQAQQKALEWAHEVLDFHWGAEYEESLNSIESEFPGLRVHDWSVSPCSFDYSADIPQSAVRGLKLKNFNPDYMPTGFCGDCAFWQTFHREFKRTGDAKGAIDSGLWEFFKAWRDDWADSLSDEQLAETIRANEYEFTENGERA